MIAITLHEFALRFTWAVLHFLWVGVALALVIFAVERLLVRGAAARHALHLFGILLLAVALPVCWAMVGEPAREAGVQVPVAESGAETAPVPGNPEPRERVVGVREAASETDAPRNPAEPAAMDAPAVKSAAETEPGASWLERGAPWVAGAYLAGLLAMSLRLLVGLAGTRRLRRRCEPVESGIWLAAMHKMCGALAIRTRPLLAWSRDVAAPVLIGLAKPVVLLPVALASRLTPSQLEAVLAHELAHLRRLDPWAVAVQRVVETVLFFHPAVWWMSRRLDCFREEACDDLVVAAGCDPADYAEALVRCSELRLEGAGLSGRLAARLSATGKGGDGLRHRVLRLLGQHQRVPIRPGRAGWILGAAAVLGVTLAAISGTAVRADLRDFDFDDPPGGYEKGVRVADRNHAINVGGLRFRLAKFERVEEGFLEADLGVGEGFEVVLFRVFDHVTRKVLHDSQLQRTHPDACQFHVERIGAGSRIRMKEAGGRFPEKIDLWLRIATTGRGETIVLPAVDGTAARHDGSEIVVTSLLEGRSNGKQKRPGGPMIWDRSTAHDKERATTVNFEIRGDLLHGDFHFVGVKKDGTRHPMDHRHFWNFKMHGRHAYVMLDVPRDDLDHLELVPFKERHKFIFNGVEVPGRLPELSAEQRREVKRLVGKAHARDRGERDAVVRRLVEIGPGVAPEMVQLLWAGGFDVAERVLHELAPDPAVQDVLVEAVEAARGRHINVTDGLLVTLGSSGNREHADFIATFLPIREVAAVLALRELGGERARDHLIGAFDQVPAKGWVAVIHALEAIGGPAAVPELERRLTEVEQAPDGRFYKVTAKALRHAIATLAGKAAGEVIGNDELSIIDTSGSPIAGARVQFDQLIEGKYAMAASFTSDIEGKVAIPDVEDAKRLFLRVEAPGYVSRKYSHNQELSRKPDGGWFTGVNSKFVVLLKSGTVSGRVLGPDGKPLAGAPLSMTTTCNYKDYWRGAGSSPNRNSYFVANHLRAISDEKGQFRFDGVPPGDLMIYYPWEGPIQGEIDSGRWKPWTLPGQQYPQPPVTDRAWGKSIRLTEGEHREDIVVDLWKSSARIDGQVVDAAGQPVAGAVVRAVGKLENDFTLSWPDSFGRGHGTTDADGRFRLSGLPPGSFVLNVKHATLEAAKHPVEIETKADEVVHAKIRMTGTQPMSAAINRIGANQRVGWGKPSGGLRCRLVLEAKEVEPSTGSFRDMLVYVTYEVQNLGDKDVKFLPANSPLGGVNSAERFEVHDETGRAVDYRGKHAERLPPTAASFVSLKRGQILSGRVGLPYDFSKPGLYRIVSKTAVPPDNLRFYYGDNPKLIETNPDDIWTGELESNQITVRIIRSKGPWGEPSEHGLALRLRNIKEGPEVLLKADLGNKGYLVWKALASRKLFYLEVGGIRYENSGEIVPPTTRVEPGQVLYGIDIPLDGGWLAEKKPQEPLQFDALASGKHAVRIGFIAEPAERKHAKPVPITSNTVEIQGGKKLEGRQLINGIEEEESVAGASAAAPRFTLPEMVPVSSPELGLTFDRPASWVVDAVPPVGAEARVDFMQPDSERVEGDHTQASLRVVGIDAGGPVSIDVTSPPDPKANASRILQIDGVPARLTAFRIGKGNAAQLMVQFAKGTWSYDLQMVYPRNRHDEYLKLALAVCESVRFATGTLDGRLLDRNGRPVAWATVVLCDIETGIPLHRKTFKPFTEGEPDLEGLAVAVTDGTGKFQFDGVPHGSYRLLAQSWPATNGVTKVFEKNGPEIVLRGVAEDIQVPSDEAEKIVIRPLGDGVVTLDEDFPNSDALLVVSTKPLAYDPILGFASWRGSFLQGMIGANRMPKGFTRISGLPDGEIHLSVFTNDNNGGIGAGSVIAKAGETVQAAYIPIVCGWSNGRHDPPAELMPAFRELQKIAAERGGNIDAFLGELLRKEGVVVDAVAKAGKAAYFAHLDQPVVLPSGRKVRFADVLASALYLYLQRRAGPDGGDSSDP